MFLFLLCGVVVLLGNGCVSAGFYLFAGSYDARYPEYEKSEFYLKQSAERIVLEKKFASPMQQEEIRKFVENNLTQALGVPVSVKLPYCKKDKFNDTIRMVVYRFPKANAMQTKAEPLGMAVGMTLGAFEVFDPIILPFAIYEHTLASLCPEMSAAVSLLAERQNAFIPAKINCNHV